MSANSSNARYVSANSLGKTIPKTPGSSVLPMSPILVHSGVTQKTASTARKSASIGSTDFPSSAKLHSTLRRPNEESSSEFPISSRVNNTAAIALSGSASLITKGTQLSKKRKRLPFHEEDDIVRSDLLSRRTVRLVTTTSAVSTATNKPQTACDLNNNPPTAQAQGIVATAEDLIIERPLPEPNVFYIDFPTVCNQPSDSAGEVSRPPKRKPKPIHSILNSGRISNEVTIIDSDDDDRPPSATTPSMASIALVENAGEATVIDAGEVSTSAYCTPKQSLFSQRVKNIREVMGQQDITKSTTPSLDTELREESNASNSKPPLPTVTEEVVVTELGVIPNSVILAENQPTIGEGDASNHEATSETVRSTVSEIDKPIAWLVKPANLPNGVTKIQTSESVGPLDTVISETTPTEVDLHRSDMEDIGKPKVDISASQIESDMVLAGIVHVKGESSETKELDLEDQLPPIASMIGDCPSESVADSAPSQNRQPLVEVAADSNLPGVRGQVIRRFLELEDKYARMLRQQAGLLSHDRVYIDHEFFKKCVDPSSTSDDELQHMVCKLEHTIFTLYEEASQYIISHQFYRITPGVLLRGRIDNYFLHERHKLRLHERLRFLLQEITVMTFSNSKIMFEAWLRSGRQKLEGKIVLSTESILELVKTHKKISLAIQQEARTAAGLREEDQDMDDGAGIRVSGQDSASDIDNIASTTTPPGLEIGFQLPMAGDQPGDVEMADAVGDAVDSLLDRRNSLIIKLPAPRTVLRELDKTSATNCVSSIIAPPICETATTSVIPRLSSASSEFFLDSPTLGKPNARAKLPKHLKNNLSSQFSGIIEQMDYFRDTRIEQMTATQRERYDPYFHRIRQLDRERSKIRDELLKITEDAVKKSAEFDRQLTELLFEATYLDNQAKLDGLGINGYLPPERDLQWEVYRQLHRDKADHETDVAAIRAKLIRRGQEIHDEKRRLVAHHEQVVELQKDIQAQKKTLEHMLLMSSSYQRRGWSSYSHSYDSVQSSREASTAVGAASDRPPGDGMPETSGSSGPSSIFSDEVASTPATIVPERPNVNKCAAFQGMRQLFDNVNDGYGAMLLAGILDAELLPKGDPVPNHTGSSEGIRRRKKRPIKGW